MDFLRKEKRKFGFISSAVNSTQLWLLLYFQRCVVNLTIVCRESVNSLCVWRPKCLAAIVDLISENRHASIWGWTMFSTFSSSFAISMLITVILSSFIIYGNRIFQIMHCQLSSCLLVAVRHVCHFCHFRSPGLMLGRRKDKTRYWNMSLVVKFASLQFYDPEVYRVDKVLCLFSVSFYDSTVMHCYSKALNHIFLIINTTNAFLIVLFSCRCIGLCILMRLLQS